MVGGAIAHLTVTPEPDMKLSLHVSRSTSVKQALVKNNGGFGVSRSGLVRTNPALAGTPAVSHLPPTSGSKPCR